MTCPGCSEPGIRGYCAQCVADRKRGELPAPDLSPADPLTPEQKTMLERQIREAREVKGVLPPAPRVVLRAVHQNPPKRFVPRKGRAAGRRAARERARTLGVDPQLTAPVGPRQVSVAHKNAIRGLASRGSTLEAIAADTGILVEAVRRVLAE